MPADRQVDELRLGVLFRGGLFPSHWSGWAFGGGFGGGRQAVLREDLIGRPGKNKLHKIPRRLARPRRNVKRKPLSDRILPGLDVRRRRACSLGLRPDRQNLNPRFARGRGQKIVRRRGIHERYPVRVARKGSQHTLRALPGLILRAGGRRAVLGSERH